MHNITEMPQIVLSSLFDLKCILSGIFHAKAWEKPIDIYTSLDCNANVDLDALGVNNPNFYVHRSKYGTLVHISFDPTFHIFPEI